MTVAEAVALRDAALDRAQEACKAMLLAMSDALAAASAVRSAVEEAGGMPHPLLATDRVHTRMTASLARALSPSHGAFGVLRWSDPVPLNPSWAGAEHAATDKLLAKKAA